MAGHLPWIPVQAKRIVQEQQAKEAAAAARREEARRAEEAEAKRIEAPILNTFFAGKRGPKDVEQHWRSPS